MFVICVLFILGARKRQFNLMGQGKCEVVNGNIRRLNIILRLIVNKKIYLIMIRFIH